MLTIWCKHAGSSVRTLCKEPACRSRKKEWIKQRLKIEKMRASCDNNPSMPEAQSGRSAKSLRAEAGKRRGCKRCLNIEEAGKRRGCKRCLNIEEKCASCDNTPSMIDLG